MITPSGMTVSQYNDLLALEHATHARVTFTIENVVFQDEELDYSGGIHVSSYMNPDEEMKFGTAFCKEASVHFIRSEKTDNLNWLGEYKLEFGVDNGDSIKWITIGYFTGERPTWYWQDVIELPSWDRMRRFEVEADTFLGDLTYPCTMQDIYDALCSYVGVTNTTGDEISAVMAYEYTTAPKFSEGMTCRELLSMIAVANCCYARINNEGHVQLIWYSNHENDYRLDWDDCYDLDISDLQVHSRVKWKELEPLTWGEVENVTYGYYDTDNEDSLDIRGVRFSWKDDEDEFVISVPPDGAVLEDEWGPMKSYSWGFLKGYTWAWEENANADGNTYTIVNNPLIYHDTDEEIGEHLTYILTRLYGFSLKYVARVEAVGNWLVEAGDVIQFEVKRRQLFAKYPIFNHVLNWNGACRAEYETTGNIRREDVVIE